MLTLAPWVQGYMTALAEITFSEVKYYNQTRLLGSFTFGISLWEKCSAAAEYWQSAAWDLTLSLSLT